MFDPITFVKAIHVLCGMVFLGISIASYFYITHSTRFAEPKLLHYALKTSLLGDFMQGIMILVIFATAGILVPHTYPGTKPLWISVAYIAFSTVVILWASLIMIKRANYKNVSGTLSKYKKTFHLLYLLTLLIFMLIIHDAILHKTLFSLLRK